MLSLISLDEIKPMLRIDGDESDHMLMILIGAASAAVMRYLDTQAPIYVALDADGALAPDAVVPPEVKIAVAGLVGHFFDNPTADPEEVFGQGRLPYFVTAPLYQMRDPALA